MFSVVYTLAMPGEDCDTVIPADSDTGRIITSRILQLEDDEHSLEWVTVGDTDFTLTALVYNEMFPKGRKGASVKEVADLLGVSADVVRDLLADGEIVGWRVKTRVIVSTDSVIEFLQQNEWY